MVVMAIAWKLCLTIAGDDSRGLEEYAPDPLIMHSIDNAEGLTVSSFANTACNYGIRPCAWTVLAVYFMQGLASEKLGTMPRLTELMMSSGRRTFQTAHEIGKPEHRMESVQPVSAFS